MISILHPSRSRPEKAKETAQKWLDNAGCDVEYILSLDDNDPDRIKYPRNHISNRNRSAVDAINRAAIESKGNIIIQIAEDFEPFPLWGKRILEVTEGKKDWILKTKDGIQDWMITLPIMDREYYQRFGYVYHPDYLHMFCDFELSCVADLTGRRLTSNLLFKHNHYSVVGGKDEIGIKADSTWAQGEKLFIERYRNMFDLSLEDIKGKITNQNTLNWIKGKL